ncbi:hypothetical protein B0O99DRAFT_742415 [Bisporella sp. PMI_857]|nr:hypothetical protein B0O99DRAFT_742415 [Bisporella sp. PMI_857]
MSSSYPKRNYASIVAGRTAPCSTTPALRTTTTPTWERTFTPYSTYSNTSPGVSRESTVNFDTPGVLPARYLQGYAGNPEYLLPLDPYAKFPQFLYKSTWQAMQSNHPRAPYFEAQLLNRAIPSGTYYAQDWQTEKFGDSYSRGGGRCSKAGGGTELERRENEEDFMNSCVGFEERNCDCSG